MSAERQVQREPGNQMESRHDRGQGGNADFPWDDFDSANYFDHNYSVLRHDDQQILEAIRDFFVAADLPLARDPLTRDPLTRDLAAGQPLRGLDLGAGTNLYPTLAMLPFCADVTLWEFSARNCEWLRNEIRGYSSSWDKFWEQLTVARPYQSVSDPRRTLADRTEVRQGSVFDLPAAQWDIGTMFFVAESLTSSMDEFAAATHRFIAALRPGAPFAAAFMENSAGYDVGDTRFPAVAVTQESVRACLEQVGGQLEMQHIDAGINPLRDGYSGMILVTGTAGVA
jgi:hypothetical protein